MKSYRIHTALNCKNRPLTWELPGGRFFAVDGNKVGRWLWWLRRRLSCGWLLAIWPNEWLDDDEDWRRGCIPASNDIADCNIMIINTLSMHMGGSPLGHRTRHLNNHQFWLGSLMTVPSPMRKNGDLKLLIAVPLLESAKSHFQRPRMNQNYLWH